MKSINVTVTVKEKRDVTVLVPDKRLYKVKKLWPHCGLGLRVGDIFLIEKTKVDDTRDPEPWLILEGMLWDRETGVQSDFRKTYFIKETDKFTDDFEECCFNELEAVLQKRD